VEKIVIVFSVVLLFFSACPQNRNQLIKDKTSPATQSQTEEKTNSSLETKSNEQKEKSVQEKLFSSIAGNKSIIVEYLVNKEKADVNSKNKNGISALVYSILYLQYRGQFRIIKFLIEKGADVNLPCDNGKTPLIYAAGVGHGETIDLLIEHGADINYNGAEGTALMEAVKMDKPKTIKILLDKGADINIKSIKGKTALDFAREQENTEIINILEKSK